MAKNCRIVKAHSYLLSNKIDKIDKILFKKKRRKSHFLFPMAAIEAKKNKCNQAENIVGNYWRGCRDSWLLMHCWVRAFHHLNVGHFSDFFRDTN